MLTWKLTEPRRICVNGQWLAYCVGDCLSTDAKPTEGIYNGSYLYEMDTKTGYRYDAEGQTWRPCPASGGGGGDVDVATPSEVEEVLNDG